jgi:hypothetical protein
MTASNCIARLPAVYGNFDQDSDGSDCSASPPFSHIGVTRCTNSAKQDDEEKENQGEEKEEDEE